MRPAASIPIFFLSFHLTRIIYFSILELSILMASDNCESSKLQRNSVMLDNFVNSFCPGAISFEFVNKIISLMLFITFFSPVFFVQFIVRDTFFRKSFDMFEPKFGVFIVHLLINVPMALKQQQNKWIKSLN